MGTTLGQLFVDLLLRDDTFKPDLKAAEKNLDGFGDKVTNLASTINNTLLIALGAVTASVTGIVAASAVIGAAFEKQIGKVAILAGGNVDQLAEAARRMGATTSFSATDAADAMESLAQAGFDTTQVIAGTEAALALAAASGGDLSQATSILASTMSQFSLGAQDAGNIADIFTQALNSSQLDMEGLTNAMTYAGPVGAAFGQTLSETTAAVALFSNLGLEGSKAGTAFRMSMSQASNVTKDGERILAKYGLTAKDINPELNNFGDILQKVGESGMTTTDALQIFGTEAGGSVAALAKQATDARTETGKTFDGILADLRASSGSAETTAAAMMDNVSGRFEEASGAFEEILLTIFDLYKGGVAPVLEQITALFVAMGDEMKMRSGQITTDVGGALQSVADLIERNRGEWARMAVDAAVAIGHLVVALADLLPYIVALLPYLKQLAIAWATVWSAVQIASVVSGLASLAAFLAPLGASFVALGTAMMGVWSAAAIGAAEAAVAMAGVGTAAGGVTAAFTALWTAMAAASGGTLALVAAIGVLVIGLGTLIYSLWGARDATEELRVAKERLAAMDAKSEAYHLDQAAALLEQTKVSVKAKLDEATARGESTAALRAELDELSGLTAETAQARYESGELVKTAEGFRTVAGALAEGGDAAAAVSDRLGMVRSDLAATTRETATLREMIANAEAKNLDSLAQVSEEGSNLVGMSVEQARAELERLDGFRRKDAATVAALEHAQTRVTLAELDARSAARREDGRTTVDFSKATQKQVADDEEQAAQKLLQTREQLATETAALQTRALADLEDARTADEAKLEVERRREVEAITAKFAEEVALYKGNAAKIAEVEAQRDETIRIVRERYAAEDVRAAEERATKVADIITAAESSLANDVEAIRLDSLSASERLQAEYAARIAALDADLADRLTGIEGLGAEERAAVLAKFQADSADERAAIEADYAKQIAEARKQEVKDAIAAPGALRKAWKDAMDDLRERIPDSFEVGLGRALNAVRSFGKAAASVFSGLQSVVGGVVDSILGIVEKLTGISFAGVIGDLMDAATTAQQDAANTAGAGAAGGKGGSRGGAVGGGATPAPGASAAVFDGAAFATDFIENIVANGEQFASMLVDMLPAALDAILASIPRIMQAVIAEIPAIIAALVQYIPQLAIQFAQSLPALVVSLASGVGDLVVGLVEAVPQIVTAILAGLPTIITAILSEVPRIIDAVGVAIPQIILAVVDAIPLVLNAIIEGIPAIIVSIFEAIPGIVQAVVQAVPQIIAAVLVAIPQLIGAILSAVPSIITAVIQLVPAVIIGLARALPSLIPAIVLLIPTVVIEIIKALPAIIEALVVGLVKELILQIPKIVVELLKGLWEGVKDMIAKMVEAIKDLFSLKKDKDKNSGAYSGIEYVPAPMRVVVHPGEAVIPADRNAQRIHGRAYPSPAGAGQQPWGGGGAGGGSLEIAVVAEGHVLEAVQLHSDAMGRTTATGKSIRKAAGVKVGFNRGAFTPWSKG